MSNFEELVQVMARLRKRCPWDREQNHETLKAYLIEEAYEVIEAIDRRDDQELKEELGDLLLQILFHARIASEEGRFDIYDVIKSNTDKLKRRHPHVFGQKKVNGTEEILANWECIKKGEREKKSMLNGVPKHLPALLKARRVQEKVARVGFDWDSIDGPLAKVEEELAEFRRVCTEGDAAKIEGEFGDILFSLVNLARFIGTCPEDALRKTVNKFISRFKFIESEMEREKKDLKVASLDEMDALWERAKLNTDDSDPTCLDDTDPNSTVQTSEVSKTSEV